MAIGYDPQDYFSYGVGYTPAAKRQMAEAEARERALQEQQLLQAQAVTHAMQQQAGIAPTFGSRNRYTLLAGGGQEGATAAPMPAPVGGMPSGGGTVITGAGVLPEEDQLKYDPWAAYRGQAGQQLAGEMAGPSPSQIYQERLAQMVSGEFTPDDPSYAWRYQQGQQAAERSLAARGLLGSGNALVELQQYGQGMASQEYANQFNRLLQGLTGVEGVYNTQMSRLMQMAGVNLDPTAGAQVAIERGKLGIEQGRLGLSAQEIANQWALGQQELAIKQQLANQAANQGSLGGMAGSDWSAIFNTGNR